jgi:hypothetical protein
MAAYAIAQQPITHGPKIRFETQTIDRGPLPRGSNVTFEFQYTNEGDEPLIISNAKSSCGCLAPHWSSEPVLPGGTGVVSARYDSNRIGNSQKSITVMSNDTANAVVVLTVKCLIFPIAGPLDIVEFPSNLEISGGDICRPCIPRPSGQPYVMQIANKQSNTIQLDLSAYNDTVTGHYGIFFSQTYPIPTSSLQIAASWKTNYTDCLALAEDDTAYIVVYDIDWLTTHVFTTDNPIWAFPIGTNWR